MTTQPRGPYLQAAMFCERLLFEQDGVLSIVRMIDQFNRRVAAADAPNDMAPFDYQLRGLIALKPGEARGRHDYRFVIEAPDGIRHDLTTGSVHFQGGPNHGFALPIEIAIRFEQEGLYWFDFFIEGQLLTRMPFTVTYERIA